MAMTEGSYICNKCKSKVSLGNIRYDSNGKDLICTDCFNVKSKETAKPRQESAKKKTPQIGDKIKVKVIGIDGNKVSLSIKALLPRPENYIEPPQDKKPFFKKRPRN